jgi:ADP-ribosylglycohydrolase
VVEIGRVGVQPQYQGGWHGISPFVTTSVLWSLYAFLRHPDDFWSAIRDAIVCGGDVDTTAAMTGAIAGARLGVAAVPEIYLRRINDAGAWDRDELTALAERFFALVAD